MAAAALLLCVPAHANDALRERGLRVHREAIVFDGHNDVTTWIRDLGFDLGMDGANPHCRSPWLWWLGGQFLPIPRDGRYCTDTDLRRIREGGLDAQFFSIWPHQQDAPVAAGVYRDRALAMIAALREQVKLHPDELELAMTAADVRRIAATGRLAALMGLEGGHAIEDELANVDRFYAAGIRYMTLTHQHSNGWADSSGDADDASVPHHGGLTAFGRDVVRRMNDVGMLVDVSHVADDTFWDVIETTRVPLIASHSSARAIANSPRNLSDAMLRAVAANGGIVMINFGDLFLDPNKVKHGDQVWWIATHPRSWHTPLAVLADHVEHVARVAGADHAGLGSDFDGVPFLPDEMGGVAQLPNLSVELLRRGWSETDLRKLLGENALRVLEASERGAVALAPAAAD
jgi:membrane dipeptidase